MHSHFESELFVLFENNKTHRQNIVYTANISSPLDTGLYTLFFAVSCTVLHAFWNGMMYKCCTNTLLLHVLITHHCNIGLRSWIGCCMNYPVCVAVWTQMNNTCLITRKDSALKLAGGFVNCMNTGLFITIHTGNKRSKEQKFRGLCSLGLCSLELSFP